MAPLLRPAFCVDFVSGALYIHLLGIRINKDQRSLYKQRKDVCKRRSPGKLRSFYVDNSQGYNDTDRRQSHPFSPYNIHTTRKSQKQRWKRSISDQRLFYIRT